MPNKTFSKTLIIGLGLIGGSFAKALRQNQASENIYAYDLDLEALDFAKSEGVIDKGSDNFDFFSDEFSQFDLVVLATPLSAYEEIFDEISNKISANALVIDLGSIKNLQIDNLPKNFIPCHPIAGSENTGFENSSADLFVGKKFIICAKNPPKKLEEIVKKIGAIPEFIEAKKHDEIYALVSHLPQFLSFLTKEFSPKNIKDEFFKTTFRLDDSDPEIWEDIFAMNEENLEEFYVKFFDNLEKNIKNLSAQKPENSVVQKFDEKFLEENFAAIFFRALVVKSYLEIPEIKTFKNYGGSGFRDFTSIIAVLNYDAEKLANLIKKNQSKISKFFDSIS